MATKVTTLRAPIDLLEVIQQIASEEQRSVNAQMIYFLRVGISQYYLQKNHLATININHSPEKAPNK